MPASRFTIRRANPEDAAALSEFGARTFADTYGPANRAENLAAHLAASFGEHKQRAELADAAMVTLLAAHDNVLAAYVQVRRGTAPSCVAGPIPAEILRFYVDRAWHGSGMAQRLMGRTHCAAQELGARTIWLGVWERNERGIAFYRKCGFIDVGAEPFWVGGDEQTDRVMVADVVCHDAQAL